jgi:hypothetical protein
MAPKVTYSQIEEMLYFSLKESIEFTRNSDKDYGISEGGVEGKLMKKYSISKLLASRVHRPVFWHLSDKKLIIFDGCGKWSLADSAKNLNDNDLKAAAKLVMKKYYDDYEYLKANFKNEGYEIQ